MQSKDEIEIAYKNPDPWGYKKDTNDIRRKHYLVSLAKMFCPNKLRTIDIACGEAWITEDLPGIEIHGLELSDNASARFPKTVRRVMEPEGKYDLIVASGCFYKHYDWKSITDHIIAASKHGSIILVSNISAWEYLTAIERIPGEQIFSAQFPYREFQQRVRVFNAY